MGAIRCNAKYHSMLATPVGIDDVLLGHLLYVALQVTGATAIFIGVAAMFGSFASWWVLLALPVTVLTGMAFAVPVFAFSAFRIWRCDRGPVLFRQTRVGRDGASFPCWRFRTMVTDAAEMLPDLHKTQG